MAKRLDTSSVSESDVTALFENHDLYGKNGEEPGSTSDSDDEEEPSAEDEEESDDTEEEQAEEDEEQAENSSEDEEEESEESEEDDEEEAESNLDWSKADPRHKAAFEKVNAETQRWQKAHSKLQSQLTRESRTRQQEESTFEQLRVRASAADQWDRLLAQHPELQQTLENAISKIRDPNKDVPEFLQKDPIFMHMQKQNQLLEQRLQRFEKSLEPVQTIQQERQEQQNRAELDGLLAESNEQYKEMFGKDMTQVEKKQVLQYMVDNKAYQDGKFNAWKVFGALAKQVSEQQRGQKLRDKAKKFGSRNKSLNSGRNAGGKKDASTPEEAIAMAFAEQGFGT